MRLNREKLGVLLFTCMVVGVSLFSSRQYFGVIYVDLGDGRVPAAIRKSYDVSGLEGIALSKKIHDRLVGDAKVMRRDSEVGIELGQFVVEGASGRKQITCSIYDRVQMVFIGENEANNGHSPEMLVEGPCRNAAESPLFIETFWIPVSDIQKQPTTTAELNYFDDRQLSLKFSHMGDEWPKTWVLDSIRLSDDEKHQGEILVERSEIRQIAPQSILMDW